MFVSCGRANSYASVFPNVDSLTRNSDSLSSPLYHNYSGYIGIGWPLGVGAEFAYRPLSLLVFSIGGNIGVSFLSESNRTTVCIGLSLATEKIKLSGNQHSITASFIIFPVNHTGNMTLYTAGIFYGTMPGSSLQFNWKLGAMVFLKEGQKFFHPIYGLPIVSISIKLF